MQKKKLDNILHINSLLFWILFNYY